MPNTELFYDPLSSDFISEVQQPVRDQTLEEKLALVQEHIPRRRSNRVKFYLSSSFKRRLQVLISKSDPDSPVIKIAETILKIRSVESESINYLDLSNDDYTKISFLNKDRYEKVKDSFFKTYYITDKTKIILSYKYPIIGTYRGEDQSLSFGEHLREEFTHFTFNKRLVPTPVKMKVKKTLSGSSLKEDGTTEYLFEYSYEAPEDFTIPTLANYQGSYYNRNFRFVEGRVEHRYLQDVTDLVWRFENLKEVVKSGVWNPEQRFHTSIHKVLNKLFPTEFTEREKNLFAEAYYKLVVIKDKNYDFSIVSGEAIREAYLEDNYATPVNGGTLWNSCMRYNHCQHYLDMYVNEPKKINLAVLRKNDKIVARGIIWIDDMGEKHIDRIYTYDNKAESIITASLDSLGYKSLRNFHGGQKYELQIPYEYNKLMDCRRFPYIDSLRFYDTSEECFVNFRPSSDCLEFTNTDGSYSGEEEYQCEFCDATSPHSDFVSEITRGRYRGSYGCDSCTTWSEALDETLCADHATYCEYTESSIPDDSMVLLSNGAHCWEGNDNLFEYENSYGFFVKDHSDFIYREYDGKYYHPDDTAYEELLSELVQENQENQENDENQENQQDHPNIESINDVIL